MTAGLRPAAHQARAPLDVDTTDERVRVELAAAMSGRDRWPKPFEFRDEGHWNLYLAARRTGGAARWAPEFGLPFDPDPKPRTPVTEPRAARRERMIRELHAFCAGREFFPSRTDWRSSGRTDLQDFVHNHGGVHRWAVEVGLPLRAAQDRRTYTLDQALTDGRAMIEQYGRIPNRDLLARAGLLRLFGFVQREYRGDRAAFAERCR